MRALKNVIWLSAAGWAINSAILAERGYIGAAWITAGAAAILAMVASVDWETF